MNILINNFNIKNRVKKANFKKNKMNCSMIVIPNYKADEVRKSKQKT